MMRLLRGIWRVLSGTSRVITVLVPLLFVAIFVVAVSSGLNDSAPESRYRKKRACSLRQTARSWRTRRPLSRWRLCSIKITTSRYC